MESNFFKLFEKFLKRGIELPPAGVKTEKEVFYLNDFFDLLYEKENTVSHSGTNPAEYFESEKYYTIRPGIDFPMIMSYKDTENPNFSSYYYFLNGHNDVVFFADTNFTEDKIEDYEYNPWGVLLTQANKNNIYFNIAYYDRETNLYFKNGICYNPVIGLSYLNKAVKYEIEFINNYFAKNLKNLSSSLNLIGFEAKAQYCYRTAKCQWVVDSFDECWVCKVLACDSVCFDCGFFGCFDPYEGSLVFYGAIKCFNYCE